MRTSSWIGIRSCLLTLAALTACQDDLPLTVPTPQAPAAQVSATSQTHGRGQERSAEVHGQLLARQVPEFGGWYFDNAGDLNVWVSNPGANGARARAAVAQVAAEVGLIPSRPGYKIVIRQGRYGWEELSGWRDRIEAIADGSGGVRWVDLDETINRVAVGVTSGRARAQMRKRSEEAGVPRGALSIEMVDECSPDAIDCNDPCTLDPTMPSCQDPCSIDPSDPSCSTDFCETYPDDASCHAPPDEEWSGAGPYAPVVDAPQGSSLEAPFDFLIGGIRTASMTRRGEGACSIGAVARHPTYGAVFLTNSHCTYDEGEATPGTPLDFYQHFLSAPLFVGNEVADPPYWKASDCGYLNYYADRCYLTRNSDAALIKVENRGIRLGRIARPTGRRLEGQGAGPIEIDPQRPEFVIVLDQNSSTILVARGNRLDKVGATTGWTSGRVQSVCVTWYQNFPKPRRHLCQNVVNYTNAEGDSGGPVFYFANDARSEVWFMGIHHRKQGVYSPARQIAKDLPGLVYR